MREKNNRKAAMAGLCAMVVLSAVLIGVSEPVYKAIAGRTRPVSEEPIYNVGVYSGTARGYGGPVTVTMEVSEYEIKDVKIEAPDETPEIGKSVSVKLSKEIWLNQSHSLDSVSGATMTSNAIKKALAECLRGAAREGTELAKIVAAEMAEEGSSRALPDLEELLAGVENGTYFYQETSEDGNGFFNTIEVTVENQRITDLTWDALKEDGTSKRALAESGSYIMTDNGPLWSEQADLLAAYVMEQQSTTQLLNEGGTTDAIASVSIHPGGFVDSLKKCLLAASGDVSFNSIDALLAKTSDGDYPYLSENADENGFRDQINLTVKEGKIVSLVWDCVKEDGTGKRALSKAGQYVMTENGPAWHEQADALAAYLVEGQSENGITDETGYADSENDAIASVSIYVGGFVDAVKRCLIP